MRCSLSGLFDARVVVVDFFLLSVRRTFRPDCLSEATTATTATAAPTHP